MRWISIYCSVDLWDGLKVKLINNRLSCVRVCVRKTFQNVLKRGKSAKMYHFDFVYFQYVIVN